MHDRDHHLHPHNHYDVTTARQHLDGSMELDYASSRQEASGSYRYGHMPVASYMRPDPFVSQKHPPYWGPEMEREYPYKCWERDVQLWQASTDGADEKQGPLLAARLGGMARALAHTIPINVLQYGNTINGVQYGGVQILLRGLARRFAPFAAETSARSMLEFLGFRRGTGESIDEAVSRWELLEIRAGGQANFQMAPPGASLLLLVALGAPRQTWWHYLAPFNGEFPSTRD